MDEQPFPLPRATRETEILDSDGGAAYGPFGFKIFDTQDVRAYVRHAGEDWQTAAVTAEKVAGLEFDDFTVTFSEALPATSSYIVQSSRLHGRQTAVTRGGAISARELEKELSKQGSVIEELRRDVNRGGSVVPVEPGRTLIAGNDGRLRPGPSADQIASAQAEAKAAEAAQAAAEAARDEALAAVPNAFPEDRTALKALDTNSITAAYLKEQGREGQFVWRTGDYSAQVAADTAEGRTIPAAAVDSSVGAWRRPETRPFFATDFGVRGDNTDCSAGLAKALDLLPSDGRGQLILPPGIIRLDSPLPTIAGKPLDIVGDHNTVVFPTFDGTVFTLRPSDILQPIVLKNFALRAGVTTPSDLAAFDIAWPSTSSWSGRTLVMEDVDIQSSLTGDDTVYWVNGIKLSNAWNAFLKNISGTGKANNADVSGSFIELGENCTDATIICPRGNFWTHFINMTEYSEGVEIIRPTSILCSYGVRDQAGTLGLNVLGGHINAVIHDVALKNSHQARISKLLGYMAYAGSSANILLDDTKSCLVEGNTLISTETGVTGVKLIAVDDECVRNAIVNNHGEGLDYAVWFASGTAKNRAFGNRLFSAGVRADPVFDQGSDNEVERFSQGWATTVSLVGGSPQEAVFVTLPDWVTARPIVISGQENSGALAMAYDRGNSDDNTARLLFRTFSGGDIPSGNYDVTLHVSG